MFELKDLQEYTALPPVVFDAPKTLILMSMPSVDSEEARFYFVMSPTGSGRCYQRFTRCRLKPRRKD